MKLRGQYSNTHFGHSLVPVLDSIAKWGRHLGDTKGKLVEVNH
jgi:DNA-binding HxlR family transcriptional regulator